MTSTAVPAPNLRAHRAPASPGQRTHRVQVTRWSLSAGKPLHRDALAAIVGARSAAEANKRASSAGGNALEPSVWTATQIVELRGQGVAEWCRSSGVSPPAEEHLAPTLLTYVRYLSAHRLLASGSDPVTALRRAASGNTQAPVRSARHPSMRRSATAPILPLA